MNIYLVEDEHWSLIELKAQLEVYKKHHTLFTFLDPREAIKKGEETPPDLVITDINMPGISGLQLIEKLQEQNEEAKFIILSVHSDFSYAQQGIKLGVRDYLTKPVEEKALTEAVDEAIKEIHHSRPSFSSEVASNVLFTSKDPVLQQESYEVMYILIGNWKAKDGWPVLTVSPAEILAQFKAGNEKGSFVSLDEQRGLFFTKTAEKVEMEKTVEQIYRRISEEAIVHVAVTEKAKEENWKEVINRLETMLEENRYFGRSTLLFPGQHHRDFELDEEWMMVRRVEASIRSGDYQQAEIIVESLAASLYQRRITFRQLSVFLRNMYYALMFKLQEESKERLHIEKADMETGFLRKVVYQEETAAAIKQLTANFMERLPSEEIAPKQLIPRVLEWIHQEYASSLTFQDFAQKYHVSLSYLSREFKAQTGETFSEYVMKYRVKKAKEYFAQGMTRTIDVGRLVGYEDEKYFRNIFKRVEGISPAQYKRRIQGK
ncbi:response regulator transcription factor [Alkalicoccus daliensis]|uniref:Two-component response regulator, YesN/AraC family, consists of REC and AraC-type DNA-binding domains n=1 Tax=Alkalicoccus daliensis TaxID=745820 RepID=A0A1H0F2M0_9BACI|nr:response regulator [Alkalicoccus daliensis]SDN88917.1 Two-component response regulator, YesN/AraC family, consists of REC and AraC-type DNA-binding domains [Alkalicoccus daliensis]